mmetsp:Transcript_16749/g.24623  ORF Transcript_16749/g.24623 Transcript_16749/m.24623 type:complete len:89 (-) Transcript_16749:964-1230(-)
MPRIPPFKRAPKVFILWKEHFSAKATLLPNTTCSAQLVHTRSFKPKTPLRFCHTHLHLHTYTHSLSLFAKHHHIKCDKTLIRQIGWME